MLGAGRAVHPWVVLVGNVVGPAGEQPVAVQDTMEQSAGQTPGTPWVELEVAGGWMAGRLGLSADAPCVL